MLGRLFKQNSQPLDPQPLQNPATPPQNSYEDSYTRDILYGSLAISQLRSQAFNPGRFRLVVAQDGGNLGNKQVLYDSGQPRPELTQTPSPTVSPTQNADPGLSHRLSVVSLLRSACFSPSPSGSVKITKQHNLNDLNDYMFGRGLPSSETHTATKVHLLPTFSLGYPAVLVTKLFLLSDKNNTFDMVDYVYDPSWSPTPTLPTRETGVNFVAPWKSPTRCLSPDPNSKSTVNSRFSIGIIIPLELPGQNIHEVVFSNWEIITHYLVVLQKVVTKKLLMALKYSTVNQQCPYVINRRILFPNHMLQSDTELAFQLTKLVKLVVFNCNTPKLINSHSLMKYSIEHPGSKFKSILINWALEVVNWLEFKDGRNFVSMHPAGNSHLGSFNFNSPFHNHGPQNINPTSGLSKAIESSALSNTFLASLLALLIPLRHLLTVRPMGPSYNQFDNSKEVTRIVVMTGNSMVAKKLIFILNGIIPDYEFYSQIDDDNYDQNSERNSDPNSDLLPIDSKDSYQDDTEQDDSTTIHDPLDSTLDSIKPEIPNVSSSNLGSLSPASICSPEPSNATMVKPIPIRHTKQAAPGTPSDGSLSVSSNKGWEVPVKASACISIAGASNPTSAMETNVKNIPIAQQIPIHGRSSVSNSSSVAYLSSSLNSSLSSSASNYSLSKFGSGFLDKWKNSLVSSQPGSHNNSHAFEDNAPYSSDMLTKRNSILQLKTPSPALEQDEFPWEASATTVCLSSPARLKISRTQSLLNLYNHDLNKKGHSFHSDLPALNIKRTKTSAIVPIASDKAGEVWEMNQERIRLRCSIIMKSRISVGTKNNQTLNINALDYPVSGASTFYEQSITSDSRDSKWANDLACLPLHKRKALLPNVAFVEEFRPEYIVQSCPVNPKLEAQVMSAMKNDLLFFQNNCGYEKVTSKTVLISLRAREIKLIEMQLGGQERQGLYGLPAPSPAFASQITPPITSNSPFLSFFHENGPHQERRRSGSTSYRTTIKKVFTPNRNSGDKELINKVEAQLEELTKVVAKINNDGEATSTEAKEQYNRMLFETVHTILQ